MLLELIKVAFIRNSRKGQQRSFLNYISKLFSVMPSYKQRAKTKVKSYLFDFNWVVSVSGKFAVTGRTQKFKIQPKKLPLHTLSDVYDYVEGFVNTKAGTFSIRV